MIEPSAYAAHIRPSRWPGLAFATSAVTVSVSANSFSCHSLPSERSA